MSLTPSVLLKPPAPAPHGKEPPGAPPDTPFATVLDDHQARTAAAEGRQIQGQDVAAPQRDADGASDPAGAGGAHAAERPAHDGASADAGSSGARDRANQDAGAAAALAALLGGVPLPAVVAAAFAARASTAPARAVPGGGAAAPASDLPALPAAAAPTQPAAMPTGPAVPAHVSALPLAPSVVQPAAAAASGVVGADANGGAPAPGARAGLPSVANALQALATRSATLDAGLAAKAAGAPAGPAATAPAAPRPAARAATAGGAQPAPAAVPTPIASPSAGASVGAQAGVQADGADAARGVALEHAVETVRLALRAAAESGVTHARISLNPRELGSIEVHLRQTADGLVARVVAQHAAAAQLLQHAGADLRRSLESQGLTLLRLDIGASGEQGERQAPANGGAAGDGPSAGPGGETSADPLAASGGAAQTTATATLALSNGALVDVLA